MARDRKIQNWESADEGKCSSSERESREGICEGLERRKTATESGGAGKRFAGRALQIKSEGMRTFLAEDKRQWDLKL
jgi:hypothetical protein